MIDDICIEAGLGVTEIALVKSYIDDDDGRFIETKAYEKLNDYFSNTGEMPYLVAKGRTGEPDEWILDRLREEIRWITLLTLESTERSTQY
tara:strand:- start:140 stop:412 length:273 start_codon:yes stop_codon:yes gene_type:complete